jgi:hypothetical protein
MSTRIRGWLVVSLTAVLFLFSAPPARADRPPMRLDFELFDENDPWRPDSNDPTSALRTPDESTVVERDAAATVRQTSAWTRYVLRFLRYFGWGLIR